MSKFTMPEEADRDAVVDEGGHFACKLPAGGCHCPQDIRHLCKFGIWVRAALMDDQRGEGK